MPPGHAEKPATQRCISMFTKERCKKLNKDNVKTQCKTLTCHWHYPSVLSQIMAVQSENLSANYRVIWQFLPSIIAGKIIHVLNLTRPITKLWMSSFKLKSRIWWLPSQFPDIGQPEYVFIHFQSITTKRPESFPVKVLREDLCELLKTQKDSYHKCPDSISTSLAVLLL